MASPIRRDPEETRGGKSEDKSQMTALRRYDCAALGVLILCVGALYGLVAGEWAAHRLGALRNAAAPAASDAPAVSVASVEALFDTADYRLGEVRSGATAVPRILVEHMPKDLHEVETAERKRLFIKLALPLILAANERTLTERRRLLGLRATAFRIDEIADAGARAWAERLRERYGVKSGDLDTLLRHVDAIPPSLALAQAAEESGWGTSRFTREGNALFGQRTYAPGNGIVPVGRSDGERFEVRVYDSLAASVASYMANLNRHEAYVALRTVREAQRREGRRLDGYILAGTLEHYSERGEAYIETIRSIILANRLDGFDRVDFDESSEPHI